ncbi:unnamed protein product [Gongylonema pulchrum]|uniref:Transcription initiation factor TFIID subunit 8 n=1 Tax=Gongylonema pulchrum TaxID=637853 RepID=A0A183E9W4_9BILA|nr:unnamed protein product [Gongylonema pulchrum]
MIDSIGFSTCAESVLNLLTDLCRRYLEKLWSETGRHSITFNDANMAFMSMSFSTGELHSYLKEVRMDPPPVKVPLFPVKKPRDLQTMYGPISERELAERPEHIPRYLPAMHREWCAPTASTGTAGRAPPARTIEARPAEIKEDKDSTTKKSVRNNRRARMPPSSIAFPDFTGLTAKELGFVRPQKVVPKKKPEEPSGIMSSANIVAAKLADPSYSNSKSKTKKRPAQDLLSVYICIDLFERL